MEGGRRIDLAREAGRTRTIRFARLWPFWLLLTAPRMVTAGPPERAAVRAESNDTAAVTFGAQGVVASTTSGAAGVVGAARATSGDVRGIVGKVASPQGTAAVFESLGGGSILVGFGPLGTVFEVAADGTVTVGDLVGDGSALGALGDLDCDACLNAELRLAAGSVDTPELAPGSVGAAELATDSVGTAKILDEAVDSSALATGAVRTAALADGAVESADLAAGAVQSSDIADGAVTREKIAAESLRRSDLGGAEVAIRQLHADCYDPDLKLTFATQCLSESCALVLFLDCSGGCTAVTPRLCDNPIYGYLIGPDIDD